MSAIGAYPPLCAWGSRAQSRQSLRVRRGGSAGTNIKVYPSAVRLEALQVIRAKSTGPIGGKPELPNPPTFAQSPSCFFTSTRIGSFYLLSAVALPGLVVSEIR